MEKAAFTCYDMLINK